MEFAGPRRAAELMSGYSKPWYVAGGWALDLYAGRERRSHYDLDIATYREDQSVLQQHFGGWNLQKYTGPDGAEYLENWAPGELLVLPDFQIVLEKNSDGYAAVEILLNESEGDEWIWRKNHEVRYPMSRVGMASLDGFPFLSPEIVLLFKSQHVLGGNVNEHKDQRDFNQFLDILEYDRRAWLKTTIETHFPDHPWISQL